MKPTKYSRTNLYAFSMNNSTKRRIVVIKTMLILYCMSFTVSNKMRMINDKTKR